VCPQQMLNFGVQPFEPINLQEEPRLWTGDFTEFNLADFYGVTTLTATAASGTTSTLLSILIFTMYPILYHCPGLTPGENQAVQNKVPGYKSFMKAADSTRQAEVNQLKARK